MSSLNQTQCFICEASAEYFEVDGGNAGYACEACGKYTATTSLMDTKKQKFERDEIVSLRGWIHIRNIDGETASLDTYNFDKIVKLPIPNVSRRLENLLLELKEHQRYIGSRVNKSREYFYRVSYSANKTELFGLLHNLRDEGYVEKDEGSAVGFRVTTKGFLNAENFLNKEQLNSNQAFVAMSFDKEMMDAYILGIEPAITSAGYDSFRVDQTDHINSISDEVISQIRRSKFLVADMTGHKGGVYFEAGFAHGLAIPIIYTCRHDELENLHFDIRQINCIKWENSDDLQEKLETRIKAVIV